MLSNIDLVVRSKQEILFKNQVFAVSSYNDKGIFDILSEHENFISLIKDRVVIHKTRKDSQEMKIENGILRVYRNKVYIYINFKSLPGGGF